MVATSLLGLDVEGILRKVEELTRVEFPRDVIEVSLEPKLNVLCVRFRRPSKAEVGEPLRHGIHLFTDRDTAEITAVEIVDSEKLMKLTDALYGAVRFKKPVDEPKRVAREYIRKKLLDEVQ